MIISNIIFNDDNSMDINSNINIHNNTTSNDNSNASSAWPMADKRAGETRMLPLW